MNTWKVILATLVIFAAGFITGGLVVSNSDKVVRPPHKAAPVEIPRHTASATSSVPVLGRETRVLAPNFLVKKDFLERLDHELKLKADQHEHIEKIIYEGQERIKVLCQTIDPQVQEELAETRSKIRAELTPAQQLQFMEFFKHKPAPAHPATNAPAAVSATNSPAASKPN